MEILHCHNEKKILKGMDVSSTYRKSTFLNIKEGNSKLENGIRMGERGPRVNKSKRTKDNGANYCNYRVLS